MRRVTPPQNTDLSLQTGRRGGLEQTALRGRPPEESPSGAGGEADSAANMASFSSAERQPGGRVAGSGARSGAARRHLMTHPQRAALTRGNAEPGGPGDAQSRFIRERQLQLCEGERGGEFVPPVSTFPARRSGAGARLL